MNPKKCLVCLQAAVFLPEHKKFLIQLGSNFREQVFSNGSKQGGMQRCDTGNNFAFCNRCRINLVRFAKLNDQLRALVCKIKEPNDARCKKIRAIYSLYRSPLKTGKEAEDRIHQDGLWNDQSDHQNTQILGQPFFNGIEFLEERNDSNSDDEANVRNEEDDDELDSLIQILGNKDDVQSPQKCPSKSSDDDWPPKNLTIPKSSSVVRQLSKRDFIYLGKYPFEETEFGFKCGSCPAMSKFSTSKTSPLWFNIIGHIARWHMGEDKIRTYRTVQRCIQVAPNRFQYGKYSFEKLDGKYQCGECGTLKHARTHKDKTKYIVKHIVEEHEHPSRTYVCEYCGVVYNNRNSLRGHKISKHEQPNAQFPCTDCGKIFKSRNGYLIHQNRTHKKIYTHDDFICEICGKKYWSKDVLKDHIAFVHNGQKMKCKDCGKMFASQLSLGTHRRSHNGKKYTCDICGMDFTQHYSVTRHKKTAHGA